MTAAAGITTLRLEGVRKSFGIGSVAEVEVLHGIDLCLQRGEFAALIGPSGSGKSTLLNLIGRLDTPAAGRILIQDRDTGRLAEAELTRLRGSSVGFVFQYHYLLPEFSALENVMMPLPAARGRPDEAMAATAATLLGRTGLTPWCNARTSDLSGGQQQRVAVARALAMNPPLVLADEPTGNLDTQAADGVFELLREVNAASGTSFLSVTHDPWLAARCERIIKLVAGRIVADQPYPQPLAHQAA